MRDRLLLGPVLILLLVGGVWLDQYLDHVPAPGWAAGLPGVGETLPPGIVLFLVMLAVGIMAGRELARILKDKGIAASRRLLCAAGTIGLTVMAFTPDGATGVEAEAVVGGAATIVLVGSLLYYSRKRKPEGVVAAAGGTMLSFVYLGLMFGFLLAIRREHSAWMVLWVLLVTKSFDIGAYFTGRAIGRHKLILWLSPGKTWEGLFGGAVFAALVGAAGAHWLARSGLDPVPSWRWGAIAGLAFGLVGQAGDLLVSLFKRDAGLKDSSNVLPGFGGILDVVDSPILVAPIAFWWLQLTLPGAL
ncbi:MAG: phosphatidate cytidylyltransferase [Phycisphaerales bacterium]|nr:phosphatidate cytidylyltransferase [Phycisphaerales bacterium]